MLDEALLLEPIYSVTQIAQFAGCAKKTIYGLIDRGHLRSISLTPHASRRTIRIPASAWGSSWQTQRLIR